jgi:Nif-specific regulatory protein
MKYQEEGKTSKLESRFGVIEELIRKREYREALAEIRDLKLQKEFDPISVESATLSCFLAEVLYRSGNYDEASSEGKKAYRVFKNSSDNKKIAQIQHILGNIYLSLGNLSEAETEIRDAVTTYRRIEDFEGIISTYNKLAQIYFIRADFSKAIHYLKESIKFCHNLGEEQKIGGLLANLARVYIRSGEFDLAEENIRSSIKIHQENQDEIFLAHGYLSLGYIKFFQRDFDQAKEFYQKALPLIEKHNSVRDKAIYHEYFGELFLELGDFKEASKHLNEALKIGEDIAPQGDIVSQTLRLLAELFARENELEKAVLAAEKGEEVSSSLENKLEQGAIWRVLGKIYSQKNEREKASEFFSKAIDCLEEIGAKYELAKTLLEGGRSKAFDPEKVQLFLEKSQKIFSALKILFYVAKVEFFKSQAHLENQELDQAISSLNKAGKLFAQLNDEKNLQVIGCLREKIEKQISEKSLSPENEYKLFRRYLSEGEYKGLEKGSLKESLEILAKRVGADRGFILLKNGENDSPVVSTLNFKFIGAYGNTPLQLLSSFFSAEEKKSNEEKPALHTHPQSVNGDLILSSILIPLKSGEKTQGYLYLDKFANGEKSQVFTQNQLNFAVAFSDLVALKLMEIQKRKLEEDNLRLKQQLELTYAFPTVVTQSPAMLKILWKLKQVKDSSLPILLEGETGTGKDLFAKAVHFASERKDQKYVAVNCAALPETLLESELFGHKKGSYTGATFDKRGLLEEADKGTLYLDEVADMSPSSQIKLLRVLEEKEFTRLGETKLRKVDIRLISATNRNMEEEVEKGRFRKDLFYRLNAVHIQIPPLKERREDIPLLVDHFIKSLCDDPARFSHLVPWILELFSSYEWPGNVRELENEIKRLLAFNKETTATGIDVLSDKFAIPEELKKERISLYDRLALWERQYIIKALIDNNWVKKATAEALNIPESSLRFKMKQYNIVSPKK